MSNYYLKLELRKDRPNKTGKCPVRIRVFFNGRCKYVSTKVTVDPDDWDAEGQCIRHRAVNAAHLNYKLSQKKIAYEKELLDMERLTGPVTEATLQKVLQREDVFDFYRYAEKYFRIYKNKYDPETLRGYNSDLNKLRQFKPKLYLHEWTPELIADYHNYLICVKKNSPNTCNKAVKPIKKVLRYAREVENLIKSDPFKAYNISKEPTLPDYLEAAEIDLLWDICVKKKMAIHETLRLTGLYFLLGCYTGLRYSDLAQIHKKNIIREDRVFLVMVKGQEPLSLPLLTRAKELVKLINKRRIVTNQKGNEYLKILQDLAGIQKSLHWHMARHTMAMLMSDMGFDKEVTALMLGHRTIRTTSIYHKISKTRAAREVQALQDRLDQIGHN